MALNIDTRTPLSRGPLDDDREYLLESMNRSYTDFLAVHLCPKRNHEDWQRSIEAARIFFSSMDNYAQLIQNNDRYSLAFGFLGTRQVDVLSRINPEYTRALSIARSYLSLSDLEGREVGAGEFDRIVEERLRQLACFGGIQDELRAEQRAFTSLMHTSTPLMSKEKKVECFFDHAFSMMNLRNGREATSLTEFLDTSLTADEKKEFLRIWTYRFLYEDFSFAEDIPMDRLQFIQMASEFLPRARLQNLLSRLSPIEQISILARSFERDRESSFYISEALMDMFPRDEFLQSIVFQLRNGSSHPVDLFRYLQDRRLDPSGTEVPLDFRDIFHYLTRTAEHRIASMLEHVHFFQRVLLERFLENWHQNHSGEEPSEALLSEIRTKLELIGHAVERASSHFPEFAQGARISGIFQFQSSIQEINQLIDEVDRREGMLPSLESLCRGLIGPLTTSSQALLHEDKILIGLDIIEFQMRMMNSYSDRPLTQMAMAIPTKDRPFEKLALLPSTFLCQKELGVHFPIFIYDQSSEPLFSENQTEVNRLLTLGGNTYIYHFNNDQILRIAEKIEVKDLLTLGHEDDFGYGGARNCAIFLTPLLNALVRDYPQLSEEAIADLPEDLLKHYFQAHVLTTSEYSSLFMGDDDMEQQTGIMVQQEATAQMMDHEYSRIVTQYRGRDTTSLHLTLSLKDFTTRNDFFGRVTINNDMRWMHDQKLSGFACALVRPNTLCSLPFSGEENQVIASPNRTRHFLFQRPLRHLPMERYSRALVPSVIWTDFSQLVPQVFLGHTQSILARSLLSKEVRSLDMRGVLTELANEETQSSIRGHFWSYLEREASLEEGTVLDKWKKELEEARSGITIETVGRTSPLTEEEGLLLLEYEVELNTVNVQYDLYLDFLRCLIQTHRIHNDGFCEEHLQSLIEEWASSHGVSIDSIECKAIRDLVLTVRLITLGGLERSYRHILEENEGS